MSSPIAFFEFEQARLEWKARREKNVLQRLDMMTKTMDNPDIQAAVIAHCKNDPEYFFDMFVWTYDPREPAGEQEIPMLLYPYQRKFIRQLKECIESTQGTLERYNIIIKKSRDMGASWVIDLFFLWMWLFRNGSFTIGSRKEEEVDVLGDMDTHFAKLRWAIDRLPAWMLPPNFKMGEHSKHLNLVNPNGGEITGESANPNFARGGRKLAVLFDEHAAMGNDESSWTSASLSTKVRISVSTPRGPSGKYYRLVTGEDKEECIIISWHWSEHPIYGAGLTYDKDGKPTSPWYEAAKKALSAEDVAAELDISFATSIKGLVFGEYGDFHRDPDLKPVPGRPMLRIWDPGLTFAVLFMQVDEYNRVLVLKELVMTGARLHDVAEEVIRISNEFEKKYGAFYWEDCGDPAGSTRVVSNQEQPEYETLLRVFDIDVDFAFMREMPSQMRVKTRITAVRNKLSFLVAQTRTMALQVNTTECPILNKALGENYFYKVDKHTKKVDENRIDEIHPYEDVVDCLGYGVVYKCGVIDRDNKKRSYEVVEDPIEWNGHMQRVG